jgi:hypothetical protein
MQIGKYAYFESGRIKKTINCQIHIKHSYGKNHHNIYQNNLLLSQNHIENKITANNIKIKTNKLTITAKKTTRSINSLITHGNYRMESSTLQNIDSNSIVKNSKKHIHLALLKVFV